MQGRGLLHAGFTVVCALLPLSVTAQTGTQQLDPSLHRRSDTAPQTKPPVVAKLSGISSLPPDASGEYMIDEEGSVVQITIEDNRLTGYITKLVERESTLTFFFDQTTLGGKQIRFTTKQVHGMWYSFDGVIMRGEAASEAETGFYLLRGTLVLHSGNQQETMNVSYRSTPRSVHHPANE
jgi:hypothetical protein